MRTDELMRGDFVYMCGYGQKHIVKVVGLSDQEVRVITKDGEATIAQIFVEPIPLTASILELNGIKPESHCDLSKPRWT